MIKKQKSNVLQTAFANFYSLSKRMNGIKARALLLVFVLFCGASFAAAQTDDNPRAEFFAGYSVLGINYEAAPPAFPQPVIVAFDGKQFLNKGVNVSGTYYLTKRFGLTADFSAHFKTNNTPLTNGNIEDKIRILNVLGGPQYKFRNSSRVTPFVRGLAGVAVTSSKLKVMSSFTGEDTSSSTDFALALGGGVDVRVNKRLDLRVFQADYNPVFLSGGNELGFGKSRADNVRFSFGVVLK